MQAYGQKKKIKFAYSFDKLVAMPINTYQEASPMYLPVISAIAYHEAVSSWELS